uniref:Organic cation transporter protein-like n=1 Tax=Phallusia mammillata TaxID=59560 RepID=A0A6F9DSP8_9ASCI|nr:organic cation transporter protein-like [Phallusia mammillata]
MENLDEKRQFGRYEKRLCLLMFLAAIPNPFSNLQFLVTQYTPPFYCATTTYQNNTRAVELQQNVSNASNQSQQINHCWMHNVTAISANESSSIQPCRSFYFAENVETVTTQFTMVCEKAWWKPTFVSLYMIGKMAGCLVAGVISDRFGRRLAFLLFTAGQFVCSIITSFSTGLITYGIFVGAAGGFASANFEVATVIGSEYVTIEKRSLAYLCTVLGYGMGYVLFALCSFLFTSWRWFLVFGGLLGLPFIPYYWLIDETPTWLLAKGQTEKAEQILRKNAKYNGFTETSHRLVKPSDTRTISQSTCLTFGQILKEKRLAGRFAIMLLSWFIVSLTYYVTTLNNNSLSGNRHLNILFAAIAEILSSLVYYFGITHLGRRKSYMGFMFITSAALCAAPFLTKWSGTGSMIANMFAKFTVGVAFNVLYPYNGELFPTTVRSSVLGLCNASARIGSMIAPFIIYVGESGNSLAPSIGMAVVLFLSSLSYLLVPETNNTKLPQTVQEAKNLKS